MAAGLRSFYFCIVFSVSCFSLALDQDDNQFIYNGFDDPGRLQLSGAFVQRNGLLQLTNTLELRNGQAFYGIPIKFNTSSSQSLSFSTNFVFAMVPPIHNFGGNGMALVFSPSLEFPKATTDPVIVDFDKPSIFDVEYVTKPAIVDFDKPSVFDEDLFQNEHGRNSIFEDYFTDLDTVESPEFEDIDGNHVGIDVNSLTSIDSAPAAYFSDEKKEEQKRGAKRKSNTYVDRLQ
ncbi:hypothetical protein Ddye_024517 [Dipteronia dyeriana]|uniref:Legume lectin domain-containing protein n=1 Tax=Dipteronia dyeriana TaxID=168575 RepID=A0AAD9TVX1_9ROSI|nr:hypothetical protein Ddye_024517 [Dipteronia dyeriana]